MGNLRQLLSALREAAGGGSVIDPQVVDALVARRVRLRESPLARLTPRELDVLREMAQGRGNAGIAQELSLSESSVEKHVNAIFTKLDLGQLGAGGAPARGRGADVPARREPAPARLTTGHAQ